MAIHGALEAGDYKRANQLIKVMNDLLGAARSAAE